MKVKVNKLKNRLKVALSKTFDTQTYIKKIHNVELIEAPSRNFDIARFTVKFRRKDNNKDEKLKLILKRLKPNQPKTDFSNKLNELHREIVGLPSYTRKLFDYIQGSIVNGNDGYLVKFYGQEGSDLYEEDAGDITMERMFIEKTPNTKLLEELVQGLATLHGDWDTRMRPHFQELHNLRKEENFSRKILDNLEALFLYNDETINNGQKKVLQEFAMGIENYFNNPDFNFYISLIHDDLHLGHVFLKYNGKKLSNIVSISKEELKNYIPKIKIIDVTGMSLGPQTFDLVDIAKHPVAVNIEEYQTQKDQRKLIENSVEIYRIKRLEHYSNKLQIDLNNGHPNIKKDLEFLTFFDISSIYRDSRAVAKGIFLRMKHSELYEIYKKTNPEYPKYLDWYLADLGETLRYLISEKRNDSLFKGCLSNELLEKTYEILERNLDGLDEDKIEISKKIIKY